MHEIGKFVDRMLVSQDLAEQLVVCASGVYMKSQPSSDNYHNTQTP